jgi:hypothetical protein
VLNAAIFLIIIVIGGVGLFMARMTSRGDNQALNNVMGNQAVTNVSAWREPNSDSPCNEHDYQARAILNSEILNLNMKEAVSFERLS